MLTRREFTKKIAATALGLWLGAGGLVRDSWARAKRILLPKGTNPEKLYSKHPKNLDASNLEITPIKNFGTMGLTSHEVDISAWRLEIGGRVDNPLSLTYAELTALPQVVRKELLICPGFFSYQAEYTGVMLDLLLDRAGVKKDARKVVISGPGTGRIKNERFNLSEIKAGRVFLAWAVNGKPLPEKHGYPLRVVAPDHYGDDWVKYVARIKVG